MTPDLAEYFTALQQTAPALARDASPLAAGHYGLVIDHGDGTLSKILFRSPDPNDQRDNEITFENEVRTLHLLNGSPLGDVQIPQLVGRPAYTPDNYRFLGHFRMTRLDGDVVTWDQMLAEESPETLQRHFESVGRLVAHFHDKASLLEDHLTLDSSRWRIIPQSEHLSPEDNETLAQADSYFQARKKRGIMYGDLHYGNLFVNRDKSARSLFDFGYTTATTNIISDLAWTEMMLPSEMVSHVIKGYDDTSEKKLDPTMLLITTVALNIQTINNLMPLSDVTPEQQENLNRSIQYLEKKIPILKAKLAPL